MRYITTYIWPLQIYNFGSLGAFHRAFCVVSNVIVVASIAKSKAINIADPHAQWHLPLIRHL